MSDKPEPGHSVRRSIFQTLSIIGFTTILILTWLSLIMHHDESWWNFVANNALPLLIIGIAGLVLYGLSLAIMYKSETSKPSLWRLLEKVVTFLGFISMLIAWFFSGFYGTYEEPTIPTAWILGFVGIVLMIVSSVSFSARQLSHRC